MLLNVTGVAAVAGGSTPLAFLLGGIACLALAFVVIGFTRRMASAGYAYTYASRSLGKERRLHGRLAVLLRLHLLRPDDHVRGRLPGGRPAGAQPEAVDPVLLHRDGAVPGAVHRSGSRSPPGSSWSSASSPSRSSCSSTWSPRPRAAATARRSARSASATPTRAASTASSTGSSSASRPTSASRPRPTSARRPRTRGGTSRSRSSSRRCSRSCSTCGPPTRSRSASASTTAPKIGADPVALKTTADTFVGSWLGHAGRRSAACCAAFIVCVACATAAARTLFAMGREGVLPAAFGRTHPRFQTPVNATLAVAVVATVMAAADRLPAVGRRVRRSRSRNYYFWATTGTLLIIVVYIMLCIGGIVFFWRTRDVPELEPAGARGGPGDRRDRVRARRCTARSTRRRRASSSGRRTWPLVWLVVGVGVLLWLRARRPDSVAQIGSILGEEGGSTPPSWTPRTSSRANGPRRHAAARSAVLLCRRA